MTYKYSYKKDTWAGYHIQITNCGHQACESEHAWGFGVREQFLFHYVRKGEGSLYLDGKKHKVPEGGLFFIPPNVRVKYVASKNSPWEYIWVGFLGLDAARLVSSTTFSAENPVGVIENSQDREHIVSAMRKIYENSQNEQRNTLLMFSGFFDFFSVVSRLFASKSGNTMKESLERATGFIAQNYQSEITVEEIARVAMVSRSQLYRLFMAKFGVSPLEFLTDIRLEKAKTLLLETRISVEDISNSVGFSGSVYFSRLFKKKEGVSPLGFRKGE